MKNTFTVHKIYQPPVNPLPKSIYVRPHVTKAGEYVHAYWRKPQFRHAVGRY